jgi:hypothetical protein
MWKSIIDEEPEEAIENPETGSLEINPRWTEWWETVTQEPWLVAMHSLVRWSGTWAGTEEELAEEINLRVNPEVRESEDFPSTYQKLLEYYMALFYYSTPNVVPMLLDYREISKDDLEHFDVPGWSPQAPIMIHRDDAGMCPIYLHTVYALLYRHRSPLSLAVIEFTRESRKFTKQQRTWSGTTGELAERLLAHYPMPGLFGFPPFAKTPDDPEGKEAERRFDEVRDLLDLTESSDYRELAGRLRTCAYILREFGVRLSWQKIESKAPDRDGGLQTTRKLYWILQAPHWR